MLLGISRRAVVFVVGAVGTLAAVLYGEQYFRKRPALPAPPPVVEAGPTETLIDDPVSPGRPMKVVGAIVPDAGIRGAGEGDEWVTAKPAEKYSHEKTPAERGGVDPCDMPDPGFEGYSRWRPGGGGALYLLPEKNVIDADGQFDAVIHFHGHDLVRRGFVRAKENLFLYGLSLEHGGLYKSRLAGDDGLNHLTGAIEAVLGDAGKSLKVRRIALTAWSGGYEAIMTLLERASDRIDAVVMLDGPHAARTPATAELQMAPLRKFAERAARGEALFYATHSSIDPGTYASTTETQHHLINAVGGRPLEVERGDPFGLELVEAFSLGSFHVRGYAGGGKADHCAQVALMEDAAHLIAARWKRSE